MTGVDENERILTVAAFQLREGEHATVEMSYLYTIPEAREEGYAMGLLYTAEDIFFKNGITKMICTPVGEREEILDLTHFLLLAGFKPVMLDGHVCIYDRKELLQRDVLQPFLRMVYKDYSHLGKNEMRYYARSLGAELPDRFREELLTDCDEEKSVFAIENGKLMAAILLDNSSQNRTDLLNVYVDPKWQQKQQLIAMLVQVLREIREDIGEINVLIDDDRVRKLFGYVLGDAKKDFWVQRYEKELTELNHEDD